MPRTELNLPGPVERWSILDSDGEVDEELLPDLGEEQLLSLHRAMLLSRRFDERLLQLQRQGSIGTFAPVKGQEAAQIGAVAALEEDDWMVPSYRETAAAIWRGTPLAGLLLYNAGYNEGGEVPEGRKDLPISIPVGSQIPHAAGIAYAARVRDTGEAVVTFFGDGATSQGDFHEASNFAAVLSCPVVFVCQNNQWAISVPLERQTASKTLAQKALAYGMPGVQVDGNDVLAVYASVREAVERAREGRGPTLVECTTYRLSVHTTADDPSRYRDEAEVEEWEAREPLTRLQTFLRNRDLLDDEGIGALEEEVAGEIDDAWEEAKGRMEELDEEGEDPIFEHITQERPAYLEFQRERLRGEARG